MVATSNRAAARAVRLRLNKPSRITVGVRQSKDCQTPTVPAGATDSLAPRTFHGKVHRLRASVAPPPTGQ